MYVLHLLMLVFSFVRFLIFISSPFENVTCSPIIDIINQTPPNNRPTNNNTQTETETETEPESKLETQTFMCVAWEGGLLSSRHGYSHR